MGAAATRRHLAVAQREAAEADNQLRVGDDIAPIGDRAGDRVVGADDVRHQRHAGGVGVVGELAGIAAGGAEQAVQLRAGMVEPPGRGPAVAAAAE